MSCNMTEGDVALDKLRGIEYTCVQAMNALEAIYPISKLYPLHGDLCRRAFKQLTGYFQMQRDEFFSGDLPFPESITWWTVKTETQAIMFQLSSQNTMRLYVYARSQEAFDEIKQHLTDNHYL